MLVEMRKGGVSVGDNKHIKIIHSILMCVVIIFSLLAVAFQTDICEFDQSNIASQKIASITNDLPFIGMANTVEEKITVNFQTNLLSNRICFNTARLPKIIFSFYIKLLILMATFNGCYLVFSLTTTRSQKIIIQYIQSVNGQ